MQETVTPSQLADDRALATYRESVRREFEFLKAAERLDELFVRSLPLEEGKGYLVPVAQLHRTDRRLIRTLSRWREENAFAFPTQFPVTIEGTEQWLGRRLLDVEDRILFLVVDRWGQKIGHLGYANALGESRELEIDNVVRGEKGEEPGLMSAAMRAILSWAEQSFSPTRIYLRVFHDNERAIGFYERLGFVSSGSIPLRRRVDGEAVSFVPLEPGDPEPPDQHFQVMDYVSPSREPAQQMILTAGPAISSREVSYALDAVRNGWNRQWSGYLDRFERSFADYVGTRYAIATSSCTGALHLALAALGVGPGDEVIVPDLTWVASANAILYVGATPVFADVERESWCLDPSSVESLVTERTKAILPVHLYGHPARMDALLEIARRHDLRVVEDAAPSIGAEFEGRRTGGFGDFAAFSFQGAKLLVTGEGGMLVTDDETLYRRAHRLWDQGRLPGTFWIEELGWKYKMSNLQAAVGLGQLEHVDAMVEAKRRIFGWYREGLAGVPHLGLFEEAPWARSIYWMTNVVVEDSSPVSRDDVIAALRERNVDSRPVFPAISRYRFWPRPQEPQRVAHFIGERGINLPSGVRLERGEVDYVCSCLREILTGTGDR